MHPDLARDEAQVVSVLNRVVSKVLADVNALGTFPTADDFVALPDTRVTVLMDRRVPRECKPHRSQEVDPIEQLER
jgi:hypothetical protein